MLTKRVLEGLMNTRLWAISLTLALAWASQGLAQTPNEDARIDALIRKLGSPAYVQRELARKELETIGTPALEPLRRASKTADMETGRRIAELIERFEQQILTRAVLVAKEISLNLKDASIQEAFDELTNASGYTVQIQGDRAAFADKKVTLRADKKSFWQLLDQICDEAGLMERIDLNAAAPASSGPVRIMAKKGLQRAVVYPSGPAAPGPIVLVNRGTVKAPVSYAGAARTQLRISRDAAAKELTLQFLVSTESRLLNMSVEGKPLIEKMVGEQGQKLTEIVPAPKYAPKNEANAAANADWADLGDTLPPPTLRWTQIKIKDADPAAKVLREVTGRLTVQLDLQNVLLAKLDKVLGASGKSVAGAKGGTMTLDSIRKLESGEFEVQVSMENLTQNPLGNNVLVNGNVIIVRGNVGINRGWAANLRIDGAGNPNELPSLMDAKGQKCPVVNVTRESTNIINGTFARTVTVIFRPNESGAEPTELVLYGTRTHTIDVPFHFENVPLP
jgi:hypothetical protein